MLPSTAGAKRAEKAAVCARELFTITSGFDKPSDVTVGKGGAIYVLDGMQNRIKVFDQSGTYRFTFGKSGRDAGAFHFPLGITSDTAGRIYVADSGNRRVQIFTHSGDFISCFSTDREGGKPSDPTDVAVSNELNRCYVVDNDNHCVLLYDLSQNRLISAVGTMGMEPKDMRFPFLIDRDQQGFVYISEVINTRVKVLDREGAYVRNIGAWGVEKGELYRPKGVAVDPHNRVFVADGYTGIIQIFDREGAFRAVLKNPDGTNLVCKTPTGIYIGQDMRLYVVEMLADRVRVFSLK
jgi:DNA-binding beta-propeller fold protein YncE